MPKPLAIQLTDAQRAELEDVRDHHPKPYMRERAAAILKIASGLSGRETARHRLLRSRWPDTVYEWVKRYLAEGITGLKIRPGRGRRPAFFPSAHRAGGGSGGLAAHHPSGAAGTGARRDAVEVADPVSD